MRRFSARLRRCRFSCFTTNASSTVPSQHLRVHVDDRLNLLCSDRRPSAYAYGRSSAVALYTAKEAPKPGSCGCDSEDRLSAAEVDVLELPSRQEVDLLRRAEINEDDLRAKLKEL